MQAIGEGIFDIFYLTTVITIGFKMLRENKGEKQFHLFGIMAIVLGFGDAFHLVPRVIALSTTGLSDYSFYLGIGKLITSITMTVFYLILYYVYRNRYDIKDQKNLTILMYFLAILRIILCLLPANRWTDIDAPLYMGILRNIPFTIMGIIIIYIFYKKSREENDKNFKDMYLTIILSFAFYIPVVLFAEVYPMVGMLMIPKTIAYLWTVFIGYNAMKKEIN